MRFFGFDLETSGCEPEKHLPIQVGAYADNGATFGQLVRWPKHVWSDAGGDFEWDPEAETVHGISRLQLETTGFPPAIVEARFVLWLWYHVGSLPRERVPVGWDVGQFDVQFMRLHMPFAWSQMARRSVDLNSVLFAVDATPAHLGYASSLSSFRRRKEELKEATGEVDWHDATVDAKASLMVFNSMLHGMKGKADG